MAKAAVVKTLVATDSRPPLTVALADAIASQKFSPEILELRKKELVDLVSEAARTFGFQSKTTLDNALNMSVGLLSLALVHSTKGAPQPSKWGVHLVQENWKNLVKESIGMVRAIKEPDDAYVYLFETDKDGRILRDHLKDFALARDSHQQWVGYDAFKRYQETRARLQQLDELVRWLIRTQVKRPLFWMKDPIEGPTCADEALNTLLFRSSTGLGYNAKDIILTEKEFRQVRTQYDDDPVAWVKEGEKRFAELKKSIPSELAGAVDPGWFRKRLGKGPPKVRKWESDDLPGITGFYYYQMFL